MVLIIEIIVNPHNLLHINHRFRKGGNLNSCENGKIFDFTSFVSTKSACYNTLLLSRFIDYQDNMAVTYRDIGFATIVQPYDTYRYHDSFITINQLVIISLSPITTRNR